jgi:hypothetical protein
VATVGTNSFTLTSHDGTTVTVDVSPSTTYADPAVSSASLADVKVGTHVAVFGTDNANTVAATKVAIGDGHGPGAPGGPGGSGPRGGTPPATFGTVASVGSNTFTVTAHDGTTVTVDVSSSTTYREFGVTSASIADVKVGTQVAVFGTETGNTVTATTVGIGAPHGTQTGPGHGHGPFPWSGNPGATPSTGNSGTSVTG